MSDNLNTKDRKWLDFILLCSDSRASMYPGAQCDMVPNKSARKLKDLGFIELFMPHNASHKDRWVITDAGRLALTEVPA